MVRADERSLSSSWAMSSAEGSFSSSSGVISTAIVEDASVGTGVEIGFRQVGSWHTIFEGLGLTMMDLNRCLRYLSQNPALKFVAMSPSSSSTQTMGGATRSTLVFGSLLAAEEDEDKKENDVDGEDERVSGRVLVPWVGRVVSHFFFFTRWWIVELEARWLVVGVYLNVPSWLFFSRSFRWAWRASESAKRVTS